MAFDINLGCSGYRYGLQIADSLIKSGTANRVLLATADTSTRFIHSGDRATRCLFGDGGSVSILTRSENGRGIRDIRCGTAGKYYKRVMAPPGGNGQRPSAETPPGRTQQSANRAT